MNNDKQVALITGANRGLGLGCTQELLKLGYSVIAVARNIADLKDTAMKESWPSSRVQVLQLDVTDSESFIKFSAELEKLSRLDVLINNAGVFLDGHGAAPLATSPEDFTKTFMTNVYGPYRMCQLVLPLMQKQNSGRIVNVSSGMGQLSEMGSGFEAYRVSKTAVNALTKSLAADLASTNIHVNSVCPGWVKTDMGGKNADRELAAGVASILWAALIPDSGPTGGFFRDGKSLSW